MLILLLMRCYYNKASLHSISLFLVLFMLPQFVFGKERFKTGGKINFSAGTGFGFYTLSNNQANSPNGRALTGHLRAAVDVGVLPKLTVGFHAFRNGFATDKDSNEAASMLGLGIHAHLNFWNRPQTNWYLSAALGGTGFKYENYKNEGRATSNGGFASIGLGFRRYFGDHFGIFSEASMLGYNYNKFKLNNNSILKTPSGNRYELGLSGLEFRFGLILAFGEN